MKASLNEEFRLSRDRMKCEAQPTPSGWGYLLTTYPVKDYSDFKPFEQQVVTLSFTYQYRPENRDTKQLIRSIADYIKASLGEHIPEPFYCYCEVLEVTQHYHPEIDHVSYEARVLYTPPSEDEGERENKDDREYKVSYLPWDYHV